MVHVWDERHVEVQDGQNELPAVIALRQRTRELLSGLSPSTDIGCGTGTGALDLSAPTFGLDASWTMCAEARSRGVATCVADACAVPLRSRSVGAVRCDRVLYHLAEPAQALAEATRILRPGGRIACAHPDHESVVLEVPEAPPHLVSLVKRGRTELNYVNGTVPRKVPRMLLDLGYEDVRTEAFTVVVDHPDAKPFAIPLWLREWKESGRVDVSDDDLSAWDSSVEAARREGGFLFTLSYLLTYGTRP